METTQRNEGLCKRINNIPEGYILDQSRASSYFTVNGWENNDDRSIDTFFRCNTASGYSGTPSVACNPPNDIELSGCDVVKPCLTIDETNTTVSCGGKSES